jgi:hypothetical protein
MNRNPGCSSASTTPSSPAWKSASQEAGSIGSSILDSPSAESLIEKFAASPSKPEYTVLSISFDLHFYLIEGFAVDASHKVCPSAIL